MKKFLLTITIVMSLLIFISCDVNSPGNGGNVEINTNNETILVSLFLHRTTRSDSNRGIDLTDIVVRHFEAHLSGSVVSFLDADGNSIRSITVPANEYEILIEEEFTLIEISQITQLRLENNWVIVFDDGALTDTTVTETDLTIETGYTLITINIGNYFGVGFIVNTTEQTYESGFLQITREQDIINPVLPYNFGEVRPGEIREEVFTLENSGSGDLAISQIEVSGIDPDSFSVTGGIGTLTAGDTTLLTISYTPHTTGTHSAEVIIHSDDVTQPEITLVVYGTSYRYVAEEVIFTTPGLSSWTAPAGIVNAVATVSIVGGGAGGNGATSTQAGIFPGTGGDAGIAVHHFIDVKAAQQFSITVGAGGASGTTSGSGSPGGNSRLTSGDINITANGGNPGSGGDPAGKTNGTGYGSGGAGGTSSSVRPTAGQNGMVSIVWSGYIE